MLQIDSIKIFLSFLFLAWVKWNTFLESFFLVVEFPGKILKLADWNFLHQPFERFAPLSIMWTQLLARFKPLDTILQWCSRAFKGVFDCAPTMLRSSSLTKRLIAVGFPHRGCKKKSNKMEESREHAHTMNVSLGRTKVISGPPRNKVFSNGVRGQCSHVKI